MPLAAIGVLDVLAALVVVVLFGIFFLAGRTGPLASWGRNVDGLARARNRRFESDFESPRDESKLL
jgi:hypothetical protein